MPEFASLEEVYGAPFGKRAPVTQSAEATVRPVMARKSEETVAKHKTMLDSLTASLPISTEQPNYKTSSPFFREPSRPIQRVEAFSDFAYSPPADFQHKQLQEQMARILTLIEQNKTGHETPPSHDMLLYIFTGVFFLFTFDQFVALGKQMR
jgi:hypothetical protein